MFTSVFNRKHEYEYMEDINYSTEKYFITTIERIFSAKIIFN